MAEALDSGLSVSDLTFIRGSVYKARDLSSVCPDYITLPSYLSYRRQAGLCQQLLYPVLQH